MPSAPRAILVALLGLAVGLAWALAGQVPATAVTSQATLDQARGSADRDGDRIADDLAVVLADAGSDQRIDVLVRGLSAAAAQRQIGSFPITHDYATPLGFAASLSPAQVRALARLRSVARVDADHVVTVQSASAAAATGGGRYRAARPETPPQQAAPPATSASICVLDTGIDPSHRAFAQSAIGFVDLVAGASAAYDDHGHGTHLAGVAARLAPRSPLFVAKVLDDFGEGPESRVLAGLDWCLDQPGVRVVLAGFGGPGGDGASVLEHGVDEAARAHSVVFVAAAGNLGDRPGSITSPGSAERALTIGAVAGLTGFGDDAMSGGERGIYLAPFSSRGPTLAGLTKPDVVAAGVGVPGPQAGTRNRYVSLSGTSVAAARIAGMIAGSLAPTSTIDVGTVPAAVRSAALDRGRRGPDSEWGAGLAEPPQIAAALASAPSPHDDPAHVLLTGSVSEGESVDLPVVVPSNSAESQPLAITVTLTDPDRTGIDVELYDPQGALVAESACPVYGDVTCGEGWQETVTAPGATPGTWTLRLLASGPDASDEGGDFVAEVHRGTLKSSGQVVPSAP